MNEDKTRKKPDRAVRALLNMEAVPHERTKYAKAGLKRKFVLRLKRSGKPAIEEVCSALVK